MRVERDESVEYFNEWWHFGKEIINMSEDSLLLASEATSVLDFSEGAKLRYKNRTITLKGKFYRADSSTLKSLQSTAEAHAAAHRLLSEMAVPVDPWVGQESAENESRLERRIRKLNDWYLHKDAGNVKLLEMVANRDTKIRELNEKLTNSIDLLIDVAKENLFKVIHKTTEFLK